MDAIIRLLKSWLDTTILAETIWDTIVRIFFSSIIIFISFYYNIWFYILKGIPYLQRKGLILSSDMNFYLTEFLTIYLFIGSLSILLVASLRRYLLPTNNEKYEDYVYENSTSNTQINWEIHRDIQNQNIGCFHALFNLLIMMVKLTIYPVLWPVAYIYILLKKGFYF